MISKLSRATQFSLKDNNFCLWKYHLNLRASQAVGSSTNFFYCSLKRETSSYSNQRSNLKQLHPKFCHSISTTDRKASDSLLDELIASKKITKEDLIQYLNKDYPSTKTKKNQLFNTEELKVQGQKMLNLIGDLYDNLDKFPVQPDIKIGELKAQISSDPPQKGSSFDEILEETKSKLMPAVTQWQHPKFFAYYPAAVSHPTVLADMFASTFHSPAFTWSVSPAHTEIELVVIDWVAKMLNFPDCYYLDNEGGGSISVSTSDAFHLAVHAAKSKKIQELSLDPLSQDNLKFSAYIFEHGFATAEKSLRIKDIEYIRTIPIIFDDKIKNFQPDISKLEAQLEQDVKDGLIPFYIATTYGTTPTCAYDPFDKIISLAKKYKMWMNLDCAYAGASWVCPEYSAARGEELLKQVDSLQINFAKMGMIGNVGALIYVKNKKDFCSAFRKDRTFEMVKSAGSLNVDAKDWMIGFGRRWNSLKFYYNIRAFGVEGYQEQIRQKVALANKFEQLVRNSERFEIFCKPELTLVTFKLKVPIGANIQQNELNKQLKDKLDRDTKEGLITPSLTAGHYFLRVVICNPNTTEEHVNEFWNYLNKCTDELIDEITKH